MRSWINRKKIYLVFILSFIPAALFGQWLNSSGIQTNILSVTSQSTKVEYILNTYDKRTLDVNGTECVQYQIPGSIYLMEKGLPQLPSDRRSVVIPDMAGTDITIIDSEFELIDKSG